MTYWLTFLAFLLVFLFFLKKLSRTGGGGIRFRWLVLAFVVKVFCGLAYGYMDMHTPYGGDIRNYLSDAEWMYDMVHEKPVAYVQMLTGIGDTSEFIRNYYRDYFIIWKENDFDYFFNDSRTVIRLHAFIRLFSFGSYGVHVIVFTFLSMIGQLLLFRTLRKYSRLPAVWQFLLFFFFPSSLVWFSGILKEPIVMLGLGLLVYALDELRSRKLSYRMLALAAFSLLLLLSIRFYLVLCLLPGFVLMAWLLRRPGRVLLKTGVVFLVLVGWAGSFDYFATDYKFSRILHDQMKNSVKMKEYFNPGVTVPYMEYQPRMDDVLLHAPQAFLSTLIAPVHRVFSNPFRALFFFENIAFLLLAASLLYRAGKPLPAVQPFLAGSLVFIILLFVLIGLTTPFEGSMVRLRSVALPFALAGLMSLANETRLKNIPILSRFRNA